MYMLGCLVVIIVALMVYILYLRSQRADDDDDDDFTAANAKKLYNQLSGRDNKKPVGKGSKI